MYDDVAFLQLCSAFKANYSPFLRFSLAVSLLPSSPPPSVPLPSPLSHVIIQAQRPFLTSPHLHPVVCVCVCVCSNDVFLSDQLRIWGSRPFVVVCICMRIYVPIYLCMYMYTNTSSTRARTHTYTTHTHTFCLYCLSVVCPRELSLCLSVSLSLCLSVYLSLYLSISLYIRLFVCLSLCVPTDEYKLGRGLRVSSVW